MNDITDNIIGMFANAKVCIQK